MYNNTDNRHPVPPSSLLSPGRESLLGSYYFPFPSLSPSLAFLDRHSIPTSPTRHNPSAQATDENDVCPYPHQPSLWGGSIWLPRSNETRHTLCAHPWTSLTSLRSRNDAPHHSIGFPPPDETASPPSILGRSAHSLASLARPHTGSFTEIAIGYPQTRFSRDPTACQPPALPARYDGPIISFSFFLPPLRTFPRVCRLSVAALWSSRHPVSSSGQSCPSAWQNRASSQHREGQTGLAGPHAPTLHPEVPAMEGMTCPSASALRCTKNLMARSFCNTMYDGAVEGISPGPVWHHQFRRAE